MIRSTSCELKSCRCYGFDPDQSSFGGHLVDISSVNLPRPSLYSFRTMIVLSILDPAKAPLRYGS